MSKSSISEFKSTAGVVMLGVPAGSFTMGSPESEDGHRAWEQQRIVTFDSNFYLAKTPVTQAQFEAATGTNPTRHEKMGDAPVDSVSWQSAQDFCQKLTQLDREAGVLAPDWEYRLPTEAEWEYACRAGSAEPRHGQPQDVAWNCENANGKPHAVGLKAANAWGFHDMLGNVWEWCQEWYWGYNRDYGQAYRSMRGGSYFSSARFCRAAQRWGLHAKSRSPYIGFRLLAARTRAFDLSPPIDGHPMQYQIYDAIRANDFDWALRIVTADPDAIECPEGIPPPLEYCGDEDKPEWIEWLLDHGADIERLNQDYGSTALICAVIRRQKRSIRTLFKRGADVTKAMDCALRGLDGAYEDDPSLDREGYREIISLLQELGIGSGS